VVAAAWELAATVAAWLEDAAWLVLAPAPVVLLVVVTPPVPPVVEVVVPPLDEAGPTPPVPPVVVPPVVVPPVVVAGGGVDVVLVSAGFVVVPGEVLVMLSVFGASLEQAPAAIAETKESPRKKRRTSFVVMASR
jgi:hypothetical protein